MPRLRSAAWRRCRRWPDSARRCVPGRWPGRCAWVSGFRLRLQARHRMFPRKHFRQSPGRSPRQFPRLSPGQLFPRKHVPQLPARPQSPRPLHRLRQSSKSVPLAASPTRQPPTRQPPTRQPPTRQPSTRQAPTHPAPIVGRERSARATRTFSRATRSPKPHLKFSQWASERMPSPAQPSCRSNSSSSLRNR